MENQKPEPWGANCDSQQGFKNSNKSQRMKYLNSFALHVVSYTCSGNWFMELFIAV